MSRPNPSGHPARYSEAIVEYLAEIVVSEYPEFFGRPIIFDPCAGTGEALRDFQKRVLALDPTCTGFEVKGIEIEPAFIVDDIVRPGDATDRSCYPLHGGIVIMTSPVYPNGVADSFIPKDESKRFTYIATKLRLEGSDARLHPNNQAGFGYRGTKRGGASKRREAYWRLADEMIAVWAQVADLVLLNVSDYKHSTGETEPVVMDWKTHLAAGGFTNMLEMPVATPRMRNGSNADQRVDVEVIIRASR